MLESLVVNAGTKFCPDEDASTIVLRSITDKEPRKPSLRRSRSALMDSIENSEAHMPTTSSELEQLFPMHAWDTAAMYDMLYVSLKPYSVAAVIPALYQSENRGS